MGRLLPGSTRTALRFPYRLRFRSCGRGGRGDVRQAVRRSERHQPSGTPDPVEPPAQGPGGRGGRITRTGPTDHVKNCVSWQADHVGKSPATFVPGGVLSLAFAGGVHRPASLPETNLARRLRSEERRGGKEEVRTVRYWVWP